MPAEHDLHEDRLMAALREQPPRLDEAATDRLDARMRRATASASPRPRRRRPQLLLGRRGLLAAGAAAASLVLALVVAGAALRGPSSSGTVESAAPAVGAGGAASSAAPAVGAARPAGPRTVQRGAQLTLAAPPDDLSGLADAVVRVVDGVGGIVASSSVRGDDADGGGARYDLRIPGERLSEALAGLSRLAHVRSRSETLDDVTALNAAARRRVDDLESARRALGRRLAGEAGREGRARLRRLDAQLRRARGTAAALTRRSAYSRVLLTVEPDASQGVGGPLRRSLRRAAHVLELALGAGLIALAVLGPLALVAGLAGAGHRGWRRWDRRRALARV